MKSNYKRLGDYIEPCDEFNDNMGVAELLGINNNKYFQKSQTNTIGIDLSKYRVVRNNQFAFNRATTRNGEKISIALRQGNDCIVSPSYRVFRSKDENELDSEYLMMWFRRPEFDRYARFKSHGSAHEFFDLEEMFEVQLPVPSIEKQRETVAEYNTVQNRIALNKQIIQKLDTTAQSLYKHWFIDFEFSDENGNPYKSSGGEMVESQFGELPKGWTITTIKEYALKIRSGGTPSRDEVNYWNAKDVPWLKTGEISNKVIIESEEFISIAGSQNSSAKILPINTVLVAMYGEGKTKGQSGYLRVAAAVNQACCAITCKNEFMSSLLYFFFRLNQERIASLANGGAQPNLSKELIENIQVVLPDDTVLEKHPFIQIINYCEILEKENVRLKSLSNLLLSRLTTVETLNVELAIA